MEWLKRFLMCSRLAFLSPAAALTACTPQVPPAMPVVVEKHCVGENGMSHFYLSFDVAARSGSIRYKFLGQDALYRVRSLRADDGKLVGQAVFLRAATGETRGAPINFIYDPSEGTLLDGGAVAYCANLQDSSMLDLPEPERPE